MPIITPEGIRVPAIGDNYALTNDLRLMAESIGAIVPVANVAGRNALDAELAAAGRVPSPTDPVYANRADAPVNSRLERNEGSGWRPVAPYGGAVSATSNEFGQIAITHGLGYRPTHCGVSMAGSTALSDGSVTESAVRDYTAVTWDVTSTIIVVRFVNRLTNAWAGGGARFGVMWTAH